MWNTIKNLIKRLFGLVDTNNDGKIDVNEATKAASNYRDLADTAKADVVATKNQITTEVKQKVATVKAEVEDVVSTLETAADKAENIVAEVSGKKRGRKPKA